MPSPGTTYWPLERSVPESVLDRASAIQAVVFDVDGVLTDGGLYFGPEGEEYKRFDTQDGHGLKLLRDNDVNVAILTARDSPALERRVQELGIKHYYSGRQDKLAAFDEICTALDCAAMQCCYVGDDLLDLPIMVRCGLAITVANANHVTKRGAHWVASGRGGSGAVREVCELVLYAQGKFDAIVETYLQ